MIVGLSEVRKNLSKLIDSLSHGETLTITRNNRTIVNLIVDKQIKRKLGVAPGSCIISEDFDDEDQEINSLFGMYKGEIKTKDDDDDLFSTGVKWDAEK